MVKNDPRPKGSLKSMVTKGTQDEVGSGATSDYIEETREESGSVRTESKGQPEDEAVDPTDDSILCEDNDIVSNDYMVKLTLKKDIPTQKVKI